MVTAKIKFQLGHICGVTVFRVLEQEGIGNGCRFGIFKGSNGWRIHIGSAAAFIINKNKKCIFIRVNQGFLDNNFATLNDPDKEAFNNIIETFEELGSVGDHEPKEGDTVLVRDRNDDGWNKRIYIATLPECCRYPYVTVSNSDEDNYKNGDKILHYSWKEMKTIIPHYFKEIREGVTTGDLGTIFEVCFPSNSG